jgi:hypothetical protein
LEANLQANSSQDPIFKITRAKWIGGVAQVVKSLLCENLLCNQEALSSNASPTKKKYYKLFFLNGATNVIFILCFLFIFNEKFFFALEK